MTYVTQPPPPEFRLQQTIVHFENTEMRVVYPDLDGKMHLPRVINAYVLEDNDMAVCTLLIGSDAPNDLIFDQQFIVDSRPPRAGTAITAIGYKDMSVQSHVIEGRRALVRYSEPLVRREGHIVDVYPSSGPRQHQMPCFQCSTPFDNGMSGGPILELTDGKTVAVGVIFSDTSFENPHQGSGEQALATILWPAMGVTLKDEKLGQIGRPTLLDFQRRGFISDRGESLKHIRFSQDGKYISWVDSLA